MIHKPVLVKEVLEYLAPKPNENFVDGTVGQAGHTLEILKMNGPDGKVLGIDRDASQIENSKEIIKEFKDRVVLVNGSYANIADIIVRQGFGKVDGILLDIGYSSWQLEDSQKGFSFLKDELLDMRYDQTQELTAERIVNEYTEKELEKILEEFGEEKFARKIAKKIVEERREKKIESTFQLKGIIEKEIGKREKIHPATRTFQALRIAVNDELGQLERFLPDAMEQLKPGGRLAIISFHSLEDRIVKHFFKGQEQSGAVEIITSKPVQALEQEIMENPRARSAKLRVIVKK